MVRGTLYYKYICLKLEGTDTKLLYTGSAFPGGKVEKVAADFDVRTALSQVETLVNILL